MPTYYGFAHRYGASACDHAGHDIGICVRFPTQTERDAWVAKGPAYTTQAGYREVYPASKARTWGDAIMTAHELAPWRAEEE